MPRCQYVSVLPLHLLFVIDMLGYTTSNHFISIADSIHIFFIHIQLHCTCENGFDALLG